MCCMVVGGVVLENSAANEGDTPLRKQKVKRVVPTLADRRKQTAGD